MPRHPKGYGSDPHQPDCNCGMHKTNQYGYKGDQVGNSGKHIRVHKSKGPARNYLCVDCDSPAHEWSQTKGTNGLSIDNFEPRCRRCHRIYDCHRKLTESYVRRIRRLYKTGQYTWSQLAEKFGVTKRSIGNIIHRKTWANIT